MQVFRKRNGKLTLKLLWKKFTLKKIAQKIQHKINCAEKFVQKSFWKMQPGKRMPEKFLVTLRACEIEQKAPKL